VSGGELCWHASWMATKTARAVRERSRRPVGWCCRGVPGSGRRGGVAEGINFGNHGSRPPAEWSSGNRHSPHSRAVVSRQEDNTEATLASPAAPGQQDRGRS